MDAYYGLISAKLQKLLECGRWTFVEPEGIIEPWDAIVDGNRSACWIEIANREVDLKKNFYLRAFGEDLNGPPSASRPLPATEKCLKRLAGAVAERCGNRVLRGHCGSNHFLFERALCLSCVTSFFGFVLSKCLQPSFVVPFSHGTCERRNRCASISVTSLFFEFGFSWWFRP